MTAVARHTWITSAEPGGDTGMVAFDGIGPCAQRVDRPEGAPVGTERQQLGYALQGVDHLGRQCPRQLGYLRRRRYAAR